MTPIAAALSIVVVEGDCDVGALVERLREDGHVVQVASESLSARVYARKHLPDAIIIALRADGSHVELARYLRLRLLPETSVLVALHSDRMPSGVRGEPDVFDLALHEPLDVQHISGMLHHALLVRRGSSETQT